MKFSLIAAADEKNGIGKNGKMPWNLREDLKHFQRLTVGVGGNVVIMGRTTWKSLPETHRPLKDRINIVLTRNKDFELPESVYQAETLEKALEIAQSKEPDQIYIIGGATVYAEAISHPDCEKIYLTEIQGDFDCDAFFPVIDLAKFTPIDRSEIMEENGLKFGFTEYIKA